METVIVFYSGNGNTEYVAQKLAKALSIPKANIINVSRNKEFSIKPFRNIILGCSTWNEQELPYDFEQFIGRMKQENLDGKSVAIFGTGQQRKYPQLFVNAIGFIHHALKDTKCNLVGKVSVDGYLFTSSKAQQGSCFEGLPIDEETQGELTQERVTGWAKQLKSEFAMVSSIVQSQLNTLA